MNFNPYDYLSHSEDEIALEGLDGITVEGLWVRLRERLDFTKTLTLDESSKAFLWSLIVQDEEIELFCLETPRNPLKIFNRYECMDPDTAMILEPEEDVEDIYPIVPIEDEKRGIKGSCSTYFTRKNITSEVVSLTLTDALGKYGSKLVMVGSQSLRNKVLCINAAIDKFYDLTLMQYIMLERIGRSRAMGEITHGKISLAVMGISPKTMFYYRKRLLKLNLITKQSHRQRSVKGIISSSSLLHLTRFYVIRRPKYIMIIQKVVEVLQQKPDHVHPLAAIKEEIGMQDISSKKIFKNAEFLKYIQTVMVPYRQIYKDATEKEWRYKVKNEEKSIRCLQLISPDLRAEDVLLEDEDEDEAEEDESSSGWLDQSNLVYGRSLMSQAFLMVDAAGPDGVSQIELAKKLGQTKLDARCICRNLQKRKVIHSLMKDIGRQRVSRYVSNRYASTGHLLKEFETERQKMLEMVEDPKETQAGGESTGGFEYEPSTASTSRVMESDPLAEDVEIGLVMTHSGSKTHATVSEKSPSLTDFPKGPSGESSMLVIKAKDFVPEEGDGRHSIGCISTNAKPYVSYKKTSSHLTTRMMKRANIIIKAVRRHKVIDDAFKLQKLIINSEREEGSDAKMDKKSLTRLLDRLAKSGFLKKIVLKIKAKSRMKVITFVVDSSISLESKLLKMSIDQLRHKFLVQTSSSTKQLANCSKDLPIESSSPIKEESVARRGDGGDTGKGRASKDNTVGKSVLELQEMHNVSKPITPISASNEGASNQKVVGIKGNVGPKFVRMQTLHKLLFYLVYGYEGQLDLDPQENWKLLVESSPCDMSDENWKDYPTIYVPEISWKMFIPPVPKHPTLSTGGWIFVVDLLLRLPLCIFVQIVNVVFQSKMLSRYLSHPVKQNILVKCLPPDLRRQLLNGRRYVTYVMELCRRLCYAGLLQMGEQLMKERDQIFVYLNRKATLVDTSVSNPGYHHISSDKEYVRTEYSFYTLQDVNQYWYDMWTICMHTPLGGHMCVEGKKITIQLLSKKPEMIECLSAKTSKQALQRDNGKTPGDGRGAAGLDSAMFAHLKRNWSCPNYRFQFSNISPNTDRSEESENKSSASDGFSYAQYLRNSCRPSSLEISATKNRLAGLRNVRLSLYKPKRESEDGNPMTVSVGLVDSSKKTRRKRSMETESTLRRTKQIKRKKYSYQREIKARNRAPKKPYYDEEDKAALRRMNKLRVDWYPAEDSLLLLCKVSSAYLFPNKRTQIINFSVVRDLLHSRYPESRNKTSRACQRRINYILKNPATEENVAIILAEVKQDEEITKMFKPAKVSQKLPTLYKTYVNIFKNLVDRLIVKYASNESKEVPDLPDTYEEFEEKFKIIRASNSLKEGSKLEEITKTSDIDHYVVNALIFSSLCTKQDKESWAYQLYLAYQKYPQSLLNSVLSSIRESKMISYKKCYNRSKYVRTCLPLSTSPFQPSLSFVYKFHMKYQYEIFGDCWSFLKRLLESKRTSLLANTKYPNESPRLSAYENETEADASSPQRDPLSLTDFEPPARNSKLAFGKKRGRCKSKYQESVKREDSTLISSSGEGVVADCSDEQGFAEEGVQLPISVEGGFTSAIIGLMATKRIVFDIIIPDQMILIDNQNQDKCVKNKLLERVKVHELVSGRKFVLPEELGSAIDEDIYTEKEDDNDGVGVLEVAEQGSVAMEEEGVDDLNSVKKATVPGDILDGQHESMELNDNFSSVESIDTDDASQSFLLGENDTKRKFFHEDGDIFTSSKRMRIQTASDEDGKIGQGNVLSSSNSSSHIVSTSENEAGNWRHKPKVQQSQSRIRMYMMREQMEDADVSSSSWPFENIFINTCEISVRLRQSAELSECSSLSSTDLSNRFMPISQMTVNDALAVRKRVVLNDWTKLEPALAYWEQEGYCTTFLNMVKSLFEFIESKKDLGASTKEIKDVFVFPDCYEISPMRVVREMEDVKLLLKVGVETFRWVTIQHSKTWLIRTNKMSRSKMNSSETVRLSGVYEVKTNQTPGETSEATHLRELSTSKQDNKEAETSSMVQEASEPLRGPEEERTNVQNIRPRMALLRSCYRRDTQEMSNVEKAVDNHASVRDYEEIDVLVRPWVRLNGCLNRRVMDRMLGSVLCFVMEFPGVSGHKIADRFWPALQPVHTYELLDTLVSLGAVSRFYIRKSHKVTLFSEPQNLWLEPAEEYDVDDSMDYEAEVDCVLKLAMFIGDKKYSQDFLSKCR